MPELVVEQKDAAPVFRRNRAVCPSEGQTAEISMYLTKDESAASLRQVAALAAGSALAMTFILRLELAEPEERQGREAAEKGARASGMPFVSFFSAAEIRNWPAKLALEKSSTCRQPLLPSATSRAGQMAFARQIIPRNCWWRLHSSSGFGRRSSPQRLAAGSTRSRDGNSFR
jgi:hypothetical protein